MPSAHPTLALSEYNNAMLIMNKLDETGDGPVIQEKKKNITKCPHECMVVGF